MKAPITMMNLWIANKLGSYMSAKEGCQIETVSYTHTGAQVIITDAFGYRYEIHVETLGRVQTDGPGSIEVQSAVTKAN